MISFEKLIIQAKSEIAPDSKVLAVSGSPRENGNTHIIVNEVLKGIDSLNIDSQLIKLKTVNPQGCIGCEKCRKDKVCTRINDGMSVLYPDLMKSQALVLASPVHNYNITAWMKAFIDRLYCFYEFDNNTRPRQWSSRLANQKRKVVIVAVCEQSNIKDLGIAIEAMRWPMEALGFDVVGELRVFNAFEKGAVRAQPLIMKKAFDMGRELGLKMNE